MPLGHNDPEKHGCVRKFVLLCIQVWNSRTGHKRPVRFGLEGLGWSLTRGKRYAHTRARTHMYSVLFASKSVTYSPYFCNFFFKKPTSTPPGYLGHSAHTPGSFSMSYTKTLFQNISYESVSGLARLHTTYITIN